MSDLNLAIRIRANADGSLAVINGVGNSIQNTSRQADLAQGSMERLSSSIARVGHYAVGAFGVSWAGSKVSELVALADKMTLLDSRLRIATASQADYVSASKELAAISLRTGTNFEANVTMFSRINKAMEQMGGTTRNTTALTETLAQSLRISGASASEAASVIRQMSQALASGVLRGDEFNSLMENSPRLSQALADGMHVSIGALRAMAEAGELTSKRVITAIQSQSSVINEEFAKIPLTVGAAMENINTAFGQYVLEANKGSGATAGLAESINDLSKNLTPILDGVVTLGKIAAAVFVTQMAGSITTYVATYIAATREALAIESAHSAAIVQNTQVNIARAEATIAATASVTAFRAAQVSLSVAETASVESALLSVDASIARARATIAATSATIQSTAVIYLNRQATQDLAIAEQARIAIGAELYAVSGRQALATERLTIAQEAQAAATAGLVTAQEAAIVTSTGLAASFRLLLNPLNLLNIGFAALVGWEIGTWLNSFTVVANQASYAMGEWAKKFETLSYWSKLFTTDITDTTAITALTAEHQKNIAAIDDNINGTIAYRNALSTTNVVTDEAKALVMAFRDPQEVFNDQLKTTKALLDSGQIGFETYTKAMAKYQGALDVALSSTAVTEFSKAMAKLNDDKNKLTMSSGDYNRTQGEALKLTGQELEQYVALKNQIDTLTVSKKANEKASSNAQGTAKKAADEVIKNYESAAKSADDFMQKLKDEASLSSLSATQKQDFAAEQIAQKMHDANISSQLQVGFLTQAHEQIIVNEALSKSRKIDEVILSGMAELKDKYDQLTLSASAYYAKTLENQHLSPEQAAPLIQQNNLNIETEISNKKTDDARQALEAYNKSLDDAHVKTSDLGKVTSAIFDGALGGINLMAGAFDTMVNAISANTKALEENGKMQKLNDSEADPAKKAANVSKYAKEEAKLNNDNIKAQLTGAAQIAGAAASMFDKKSAAAKAFHAIEVTLSVARLAMDAVEMASSISKTIAKVTEGAATMFAQSGWAGFAGVAAMLAVMAGVGFAMSGGGGGSSAPAVVESASTGTVLGDTTTQSDSVNKTNQLLKDIQAQNYPVLQSINNGISGMAAGISTAVDHLYNLNTGVSSARINTGSGNTGSLAAGLGLGIGSAVIQGVLATGAIGVAAAGFATAGITTALSAIGAGGLAASISGAAGGVAAGALGASAGLMAGAIVGGIGILMSGLIYGIGSLLGVGETTVTQTGGGLMTNQQTIGNVMAGSNVNATDYATGNIKTTGWFSDDNKAFTVIGDLNKKATEALTSVFKNAGETMTGLAMILGGDVKQKVADYVIPAMTIGLYGLNATDAAKKLSATVSTALDVMAGAVFSEAVGQYQKAGEGMLETAVRIATQIIIVKDALSSSSIKLVDNVIAISDALVTAAGGLKEFQAQFASYFDKFYSDTEKQTKLQTQLSSQLGSVGESLAASRAGYRAQVEAININTAAGQAQYSMMLKLASAADTYYTAIESNAATAATKAANLAKSQSALDQQYMGLTGQALEALTIKRKEEIAALDKSLQLTQLSIYVMTDANKAVADATTAANTAVNNAMTAATKAVADATTVVNKSINDAMTAATKAVADATTVVNKSINDAMTAAAQNVSDAVNTVSKAISNMQALATKLRSTLPSSTVASLDDRAGALSVLKSALATANSGGSIDNFAGMNDALATIAKPSEQLYATFTDYARAQAQTSNTITQLADYADLQVSDAQKQIDAIKGVASEVIKVNGAIVNLLGSSNGVKNAVVNVGGQMVTLSASQEVATDGTTKEVFRVNGAIATLTKSADGTTGAVVNVNGRVMTLTSTQISSALGIKDSVAILTEAQKSLATVTEQKAQIDTMLGNNNAVVSVGDAVSTLTEAQKNLATVTEQKAQIDKMLGNNLAVLSVGEAINQLAIALNAQSAVTKAIAVAQTAAKSSANADIALSTANAKALASANALSSAQGNSSKATDAAQSARAAAEALKNISAPPTTHVNGQTTNAVWESVLSQFNAWHKAAYGINMNRDWSADGDAWAAYQRLVNQYYAVSNANIASATATADGLASVASATAALIPNLTDVSAADASAARDALAKSQTASAYAAATQSALPAFASGGSHEGGWRIVGEHGPELENTGPSRIFSNSQSKSMLNNDDLIAEIRQLREEARANAAALARNTAETSRIINRWDGDGMPATRITA